MEGLIKRFNSESAIKPPGTTIELEIRLKETGYDFAAEMLRAALAKPSVYTNPRLDLTINVISNNLYEQTRKDVGYVRRLTFVRGVKTADEYFAKTRLAPMVIMSDPVKHAVSLASETPIKSFPAAAGALVRVKARVSFDVKTGECVDQPKWRLDITFLKSETLEKVAKGLKGITERMFPADLTPQNLLQKLPMDLIDSAEVELEFIGTAAASVDDLSVLRTVLADLSPEIYAGREYTGFLQWVANTLGLKRNVNSLKELTSQVKTLSRRSYVDIYPPEGYFATIKADGVRAVAALRVTPDAAEIIYAGERLVRKPATPGKGRSDSRVVDIHPHEATTIVDCELVGDTLYIFDCMMYEGRPVYEEGFASRVKYLEAAARLFPNSFAKEFVRLSADRLGEQFESIVSAEYPFETDGVIIIDPIGDYFHTSTYKWKPADKTTIDFLAKVCPEPLLVDESVWNSCSEEYAGKFPRRENVTTYVLFNGISEDLRGKIGLDLIPGYDNFFHPGLRGNYYPIQFAPSTDPTAYLFFRVEPADSRGELDGKIVELWRDVNLREWKLVRLREDRKAAKGYYGNDFRIAELTYMNLVDEFTLEALANPAAGYFIKPLADPMHVAGNRFRRFVISLLLRKYLRRAEWVVDLAAGRGADLHRYQEIGVKSALFIDIDRAAIAELVQRKFDIAMRRRRDSARGSVKRGGNAESLSVYTAVVDLRRPASDLLAVCKDYCVEPGTVDGTICNFAFHYFNDSLETLRNVLQFISTLLRTDGVFIFTVMDGASVHGLLAGMKRGEIWEVKQGVARKYAIRKLYTGDKLSAAGQKIEVWLPFASEMYEEPLCNIDTVAAEAKRHSLHMEASGSFGDMLGDFQRADPALRSRLTQDDLEYNNLYHYVVLRKIAGTAS